MIFDSARKNKGDGKNKKPCVIGKGQKVGSVVDKKVGLDLGPLKCTPMILIKSALTSKSIT